MSMASENQVRYDVTRLSDDDLYLFNEGSHLQLYEKLGSHPMTVDGVEGTYFAVWAPDAVDVTVVGDFNYWTPRRHFLGARGSSGIWEGFIPGIRPGTLYKYHIESRFHGYKMNKTDPFARYCEVPPKTASIVHELNYSWNDRNWMESRPETGSLNHPVSIYEVHLGSWMRVPEEGNRMMTYRELAHRLGEYVERMHFTHVEIMPVMEHPFYGSWGYQCTGFFAPTSRYGSPEDFMYFIDHLHQRGIGVILDWVPSHFPTDAHGLAYFDGTHLFEHSDPRQGYHPDWGKLHF
jgi:1,4-alpha-glucan branching enzyme